MNILEQYEKICYKIAQTFWENYYKCEDSDQWSDQLKYDPPVADEPYGVWCFGDDWWGFDEMVTALQFEATREQLDEWYDKTTGEFDEKKRMKQNLKNFILYGWIGKQYPKQEIEESEKSVKSAYYSLQECFRLQKK
jgi:hypothetical protein